MKKLNFAHGKINKAFIGLALVIGITIPMSQASAISLPSDEEASLPITSPDESTDEQSSPVASDETPTTDAPITDDSEEVTTEPLLPIVVPSVPSEDLPVAAPIMPVPTPVISQPVVDAPVRPQVPVAQVSSRTQIQQAPVTRVGTPRVVTAQATSAVPVQAASISPRLDTVQTPIRIATPTAISVGSIAGDLSATRDSGIVYPSNKISPETAQNYYLGALGLAGSGIALYATTFLGRLRSFGLITGNAGIR